jgi:hypothetical protein
LAKNAPELLPIRPIKKEHVKDLLKLAMPPRMTINHAGDVANNRRGREMSKRAKGVDRLIF